MRVTLLLAWVLIGLLAVAYHFGPGKNGLVLDEAGGFLKIAEDHAGAGRWIEAADAYTEALALLPSGTEAGSIWKIRVQRAKALLNGSQLALAYRDLELLAEEVRKGTDRDSDVFREVMSSFAGARYYLTWVMRLEGLPQDVWEEEIEASRQTYRLLAERASAADEPDTALSFQEKMESAIRLARMDLEELQGLSLPKQCRGCRSCNCKKPGNRKGRNKGGQQKKDARGASSGPPPDKSGS